MPPRIAVDPPVPFFTLVDRTAAGGGALTVERERADGHDRVVVSGAPPAGGEPVTIFRSVSDPARYAAAVLRMQLAAQGITIDGGDRIAAVPPGFHEILAFDGKALADIVRLLMKYSNNNIAEMLVKDLGAAQSGPPGTWPNGVAAVRQRLGALGLSPSGFQTVDGSGLSPANRVTPRTLVDALRIARASFAFGPELESALPIAARDGTLGKRAAGAADAVRAKTGLLSGAAALSGFARGADGTTWSSRSWSTTTRAGTPTPSQASTRSRRRWCSSPGLRAGSARRSAPDLRRWAAPLRRRRASAEPPPPRRRRSAALQQPARSPGYSVRVKSSISIPGRRALSVERWKYEPGSRISSRSAVRPMRFSPSMR